MPPAIQKTEKIIRFFALISLKFNKSKGRGADKTSTHFIWGYVEMRQPYFVFVSTKAVLVKKIDK